MSALPSVAELLSLESDSVREQFLQSLTETEQKALLYNWREFWARPNQLAPTDDAWRYLFYCGGRGAGKTRVGSEWSREQAEDPIARHMIIGATLGDVRDTMIEGESGILACIPPWVDYDYKPSRFLIRFKHGGRIKGFSADKPDRLRGPNVTSAWGDEFASWAKSQAFQNLRFCLRKGNPRCLLTSTPNRTAQVKMMFRWARERPAAVRLVQVSTWENIANLSPDAREMVEDLVGTRLGRQELDGELLEDVDGALWSPSLIDRGRHWLTADNPLPKMVRVIVILDPAISNNKDSDHNGIVCLGQAANRDIYVLGDYSVKGGPTVWLPRLRRAIADHKATLIVAEKNRGGNMVEHTIKNAGIKIPVKPIYSTRTKTLRAEPCIPLYEKCRVHHVTPPLPRPNPLEALEELQTTWVPGDDSPDPVDALVIGIHELLPGIGGRVSSSKPQGW